MSGRLIVGNLDYEVELARGAPLGLAVQKFLSAAATTLAVFGRQGDRLWTPHPIAPARLRALPALELISGPLPRSCPQVLPWGETEQMAAVRSALPGDASAAAWIDALWRAHPPPAIAARCNHRRFAHQLAARLGHALPGSRFVPSVAELEAHLRCGGAAASPTLSWVAKAGYSAAGRLRLRQHGIALSPAARMRAERLFARYGELLFEPWVERCQDFATGGIIVAPDRWVLFPPHRLDCDAAGVFRGIALGDAVAPGRDQAETLAAAAEASARALAEAGYRGPFGIDAYTYRDRDGRQNLQPLSEINARMTFGLVARALAERLAPGASAIRFQLARDARPPDAALVLIAPQPGDPTTAWLEVEPDDALSI